MDTSSKMAVSGAAEKRRVPIRWRLVLLLLSLVINKKEEQALEENAVVREDAVYPDEARGL